MLNTLFWLIVFPCIVAFIIGFLTYQIPDGTPPDSKTPPPSPDAPPQNQPPGQTPTAYP